MRDCTIAQAVMRHARSHTVSHWLPPCCPCWFRQGLPPFSGYSRAPWPGPTLRIWPRLGPLPRRTVGMPTSSVLAGVLGGRWTGLPSLRSEASAWCGWHAPQGPGLGGRVCAAAQVTEGGGTEEAVAAISAAASDADTYAAEGFPGLRSGRACGDNDGELCKPVSPCSFGPPISGPGECVQCLERA